MNQYTGVRHKIWWEISRNHRDYSTIWNYITLRRNHFKISNVDEWKGLMSLTMIHQEVVKKFNEELKLFIIGHS